MIGGTAAAVMAVGMAAGAAGQPQRGPEPVRPAAVEAISDELGPGVLPPLAREGTFVSSARAQFVQGKSKRWFVVFDPDEQGRVLPPMVMLPNLHLAAIERVAERSAQGTRMLVSGQVTVYHDTNYFLAAAPPLLVRAESAAPTAAKPQPVVSGASGGEERDAAAEAAPSSEPAIEAIVKRLDAAASPAAAVPLRAAPVRVISDGPEANVEPAMEAERGPQGKLMIEGGLMSARRGRIVRGSDGQAAFAMDNGTSGGDATPLAILPSQALMAIERIADRAGEGATYTISGEVTQYRGRPYLLIKTYRLNRASEHVMPTQ